MPGWTTKRFATYGLIAGLTVVNLGFQVACHHHGDGVVNSIQPPILSYRTTTILATEGEPFTSVIPAVSAYVVDDNRGTTTYTGFHFSVSPALPSGLALDGTTGVISGTPAAGLTSPLTTYYITATNAGGSTTVSLQLGVQDSSPVVLTNSGPDAVSGVVGGSLVVGPTVVTGVPADTTLGFGVSPTLPGGLVLNQLTGLVQGSPTEALAGQPFTLTVTTPLGSANVSFTLLIAATNPVAPMGFSYPDPYTMGQAPTLTAGTDLVYTLASGSPALPTGLTLDALTGVITGTATGTPGLTTCSVTATNATGTSTASVVLTVN